MLSPQRAKAASGEVTDLFEAGIFPSSINECTAGAKSSVSTLLLSEEGEALFAISGPMAESTLCSEVEARGTSTAQEPSTNWFAVYTTPRHEKAVARQFEVRHIEAFLPLYRSVRRWKNGCRVNVDQPLFPNYIFASLKRRDYLRVLETPGVLSLVGSGRKPSPLESSEIESLRCELCLREFEPHPYLVAGDRVRIHSGALAGMIGVLVRKKSQLRVVLTLDLIMQSVAVEVGADEIEPFRV